MCGDLVRNRMFTDSTSPSTVEVMQALSRAGATLNGYLQANGYQYPVDNLNSDASAIGWISEVNAALVAARLLNQLIIREQNQFADGDPDLRRRKDEYQNQVSGWINAVENGRYSGAKLAVARQVRFNRTQTDRVVSLEMEV